ncbi:hypothetical protein [Candidatus Halobonum tyrrellensis]|uniref:ParB/Sulfiredoxin domain-containing protein n=1 Tax=Candidatus Halobonum tyrrellensis G22 TaxID=1324957 RepID=V4IW23_9EURY|nr:hypothetical protein [Candidatus Halobonum tyrrellensis]ESP87362.1 hypothetical protein K933_14788 [Candidatus Halobonum tyrrellensis G22]
MALTGTAATALDLPVVGSLAGPAFRAAVLDTPVAGAYWRVAPAVHRHLRYASSDYVDPPVDPFGLVRVDPTRITRFTGREFPVWSGRWSDIGRIMDGDWDRRDRPPVDPSYEGPEPSVYLGDRFEDAPVYQCLEAHFDDGVPWEETEFVREVAARARDDGTSGSVWQHCSTVDEINAHCRKLDRLYEDMRGRGCVSMRELNARGEKRLTLRQVMENEILVDIGRDGHPLFVTGRHRLSIAKLLGVDYVPVAVAVRHAQWVADRDRSRGSDTGSSARCDGESRPGLRSDDAPGEPFSVAW